MGAFDPLSSVMDLGGAFIGLLGASEAADAAREQAEYSRERQREIEAMRNLADQRDRARTARAGIQERVASRDQLNTIIIGGGVLVAILAMVFIFKKPPE